MRIIERLINFAAILYLLAFNLQLNQYIALPLAILIPILIVLGFFQEGIRMHIIPTIIAYLI